MKRLGLILLCFLGSCTPLYFPPVPERSREATVDRLVVSEASTLRLNGGSLELKLILAAIPEEDWLSVQWFSPENVQVASDALWLGEADTKLERTVLLPGDVELSPGEWRAVLAYQGQWVRQFSVVLREK